MKFNKTSYQCCLISITSHKLDDLGWLLGRKMCKNGTNAEDTETHQSSATVSCGGGFAFLVVLPTAVGNC